MRYVYFIRPIGMTGPVKIGQSTIPEKRLMVLSEWSPFPLEIAAVVEGGFDLESRIHNCFAEYHHHKEWFWAGPKLVSAIKKLQAGMAVEVAIDLLSPTGNIRKLRAKQGGAARTPEQLKRQGAECSIGASVRRLERKTGVRWTAPYEKMRDCSLDDLIALAKAVKSEPEKYLEQRPDLHFSVSRHDLRPDIFGDAA